jgi:hypothetical protein
MNNDYFEAKLEPSTVVTSNPRCEERAENERSPRDATDEVTNQLLTIMLKMRSDMQQMKAQISKRETHTIDTGGSTRDTTENSRPQESDTQNITYGLEALVKGVPIGRDRFRQDPMGHMATGLYDGNGNAKWGVPKSKGMKLSPTKFNAKET